MSLIEEEHQRNSRFNGIVETITLEKNQYDHLIDLFFSCAFDFDIINY